MNGDGKTTAPARGVAAFEHLFCRPDPARGELAVPAGAPGLLYGALRAAAGCSNGSATLVHYLNALADDGFDTDALMAELFGSLIKRGVLPAEWASDAPSPRAEFLLERIEVLIGALRTLAGRVAYSELSPAARELFAHLPADRSALVAALERADDFNRGRCFLYRSGVLTPVEPESVKPVEKFFGYAGVRAIYRDHFNDFSTGVCNVPLLIHSLPGYGKTSMVLSHALAAPNVTVILPEPAALEGTWEGLISRLLRRPDRRFVLFFDDIETNKVDWYRFRTNVGGAFSPPDNVMVVLSSNYEFPVSILSRGRRMSYPVFDEVRCTEMVEDFLRDFGLKRPPRNLVSLISADYTEEFGQKKFTELSPRTLMRYLSIYGMDMRKRRTIAEMSLGEVITKPDGELFYEFNIELMRSLYGEEYIKKLLKDKLKNL